MKPGLSFRTTIAFGSLITLAGCGASAKNIYDATVDVKPVPSVAPALPEYTARSLRPVAREKAAPDVAPFVKEQLQYNRVRAAREATESAIVAMFRERNIRYPAAEVYLRAFKFERALEVWVRSHNGTRFELLRTYPICALAGIPGPKRKQGDLQVPEGFYNIDLFNPTSSYHLSLRIDYPNQRDRAANTAGNKLGGDIFIHGGCKSDGCLAITDEAIQELYWLSVSARGLGQERIPVHIFPTRMDSPKALAGVQRIFQIGPDVFDFWKTLKAGYDVFEKKRMLPDIMVDESGRYRVSGTLSQASQPSGK